MTNMYFTEMVVCSILFVISQVFVESYGYGGGSGGGYGGGSGGGGGQEHYKPKPYGFGYEAQDIVGSHFHKEQGDGNGNVQGSYGYMDSQGLYRKVDYVANQGGFKAMVKTNEPGTDGKENPADVIMNVQEPPKGVQDKYTKQSGFGGHGGSGFGGGHGGGFGGGQGGGYGGGGMGGHGGGGMGGHGKSGY